MLRVLKCATFAFVLAAVGVTCTAQTKPLSTPEKGITKQSSSLRAQDATAPKKDKDAAPNVTTGFKKEDSPGSKPDESKNDENIAIQRKLAYFTEGLVLVGFIQAIILCCTIWAIVHQASVSKNIERAWILLGEFTQEQHNFRRDGIDFLLTFHNYGKTPAWVVETSFRFRKIGDEAYKLPLEYETSTASSHGEPVPPGKPFPTIRKPLELDEYLVGRPDVGRLVFYGFVRYRDVFGKVRETYVRMRFEKTEDDTIQSRPGQWIYDGPREANRHT